jgi:hypothetical protein
MSCLSAKVAYDRVFLDPVWCPVFHVLRFHGVQTHNSPLPPTYLLLSSVELQRGKNFFSPEAVLSITVLRWSCESLYLRFASPAVSFAFGTLRCRLTCRGLTIVLIVHCLLHHKGLRLLPACYINRTTSTPRALALTVLSLCLAFATSLLWFQR